MKWRNTLVATATAAAALALAVDAQAERYDTSFESGEGFAIGGKDGPGVGHVAYGSGGINLQSPGVLSQGGNDILWWENSGQLGSGSLDQEIYDPNNLFGAPHQGTNGSVLPTPHTGNQAFRLSNAKGNQGAILNVGVQVWEAAGETEAGDEGSTGGTFGTTGFGPTNNQHGEDNTTPAPVTATWGNSFAGYWVRTVLTENTVGNGFAGDALSISASQTDLSGQRLTHINFFGNDSTHNLHATASGTEFTDSNIDGQGYQFTSGTSPALNWGDWYYVTEEVIFVDTLDLAEAIANGPPDGDGSPDEGLDKVRYTIREDDGFGNPGSIVWTVELGSWEAPYWWAAYGGTVGQHIAIDTWAMRVGNSGDDGTQEDLGLVLDDFTFMTMRDGDINGDRVVNALDLSILAANWLATDAYHLRGDVNHDLNVNSLDLSILASNWLAGSSGESISFNEALASVGLGGIPEPSSLALLALGAMAITRRRR